VELELLRFLHGSVREESLCLLNRNRFLRI
jgi:hypothetical protein